MAIEGDWGAGKTTVIKILRSMLHEEHCETGSDGLEIAVMYFDAWTHEGDPLRRVFLQRLVSDLASWLRDAGRLKVWQARIEALNKRGSRERTDTTPVVSPFRAFCALLALMTLPVIGAGLMTGAGAGLTLTLGQPSGLFVLGLCLVLVVPFGLLVWGLRRPLTSVLRCLRTLGAGMRAGHLRTAIRQRGRAHNQEQDEAPGGIEIDSQEDGNTSGFALGKFSTRIRSRRQETPMASSVEFESHFNRLMKQVLLGNRRLVIVLDNLDRVDRETGLQLLSHLQVFLPTRSEEQREEWAKRLWVLVPYSRPGIDHLWSRPRQGQSATQDQENRQKEADGQQGSEGDSVRPQMRGAMTPTDHFLDKIAQVRFQLPPPALTNWRRFFRKQIGIALPHRNEAVYQETRQVFSRCCVAKAESPTPRTVKLYLNQLAALVIQWREAQCYEIGDLAYYAALLRSGAVEIRRRLLEGSLPDEWFARGSDRIAVRAKLAGLVYGVPPSVGYHHLLVEPLTRALTTADKEALSTIHAEHGDAFWEVLDHAAQYSLSDLEPTRLAAAASVIASLPSEGQEHLPFARALGKRVREIEVWGEVDEALVDGLPKIIGFCSDQTVTKGVIESFQRTLRQVAAVVAGDDGPEVDNPGIEEALAATQAFIAELLHMNLRQEVDRPFTIEMRFSAWLNASSGLAEAPQDVLALIVPAITDGTITSSLAQVVAAGSFSNQHVDCIRVTYHTSAAVNWKEFTDAAQTRLDASSDPPPVDEAMRIITVLEALSNRGSADAKDAIDAFSSSGSLLHYLQQASSGGKDGATARLMLHYMRAAPDGRKPPVAGASDEGHATFGQILNDRNLVLVKHILNQLKPRSELEVLRRVVEERDEIPPLIQEILVKLAEPHDVRAVVAPASFLRHWRTLRDGFAAADEAGDAELSPYSRILKAVCNDGVFDAYLKTEDAARAELGDADLLLELLEVADSAAIRSWCRAGIEGASRSDWTACFTSQPVGMELLGRLNELGETVELGSEFRAATVQIARTIASGGSFSEEALKHLPAAVATMRKSNRDAVASQLLKCVKNPGEEVAGGFFEVLGPILPNAKLLKRDENLIPQLFEPLLKQKNRPAIRWLIALSEEGYSLSDTDDPDSVRVFVDDVRKAIQEEEDADLKALLQELGVLLGLSTEDEVTETEPNDAEEE